MSTREKALLRKVLIRVSRGGLPVRHTLNPHSSRKKAFRPEYMSYCLAESEFWEDDYEVEKTIHQTNPNIFIRSEVTVERVTLKRCKLL